MIEERTFLQGSREQDRKDLGTGEMVQWVKSLLNKCKDLNSISKTQVKKHWT